LGFVGGIPGSQVKDRLARLEVRKAWLEATLDAPCHCEMENDRWYGAWYENHSLSRDFEIVSTIHRDIW
jgi:hypothetical protein